MCRSIHHIITFMSPLCMDELYNYMPCISKGKSSQNSNTQLTFRHYTCTVLYRYYAHPYQSSYRWDGLNFENSSFASKLSPPRCLPRNYARSCKILYQKVVPCHCQSLQQIFREDCPCQLAAQWQMHHFLVGVFSRQISQCRNFHSKVGVGVISVEYGTYF